MEGLTFEELQNQKKEVADFIVSIMNRSSEDLQTMRLIMFGMDLQKEIHNQTQKGGKLCTS